MVQLTGNILTSDIPLWSPVPAIPYHEFITNCLKEILPNMPKDAVYLTDWTTKKSILYSEIIPFVTCLASGLRNRGFKDSDVVCMYASNHVEFPLMALAIWQSRGIFTSIPPNSLSSEVADRCKDAGVRYICCDKLRANNAIEAARACDGQIQEIWVFDDEMEGCVSFTTIMGKGLLHGETQTPENDGNKDVDLDTVIWLPYSSGTTGLPKGIMHTHKTLVAMAHILRRHGFHVRSEQIYSFLNLMVHVGGLLVSLIWMVYGLRCITLSQCSDLDYLKAISESKATCVSIFPTQLAFLVRDPVAKKYDLSNVEALLIGGSTWNVDDEANISEMLPNVKELSAGFGMTEIGMLSSTNLKPVNEPPLVHKLGSSGWLFPGTSLKITDMTTGSVLGALQEGEICARTVNMMKGYLNHPEATAEFFKDNWAHTGDLGYFDETGQLFVTGRIKELIKYRMAQVTPLKLETIIKSLNTVADACVVGIPHDVDGELPAAAVVLKPGASTSTNEIKQFVNGRVNQDEQLRGGVFIVKKIPYNYNEKPLRRHILKDILDMI